MIASLPAALEALGHAAFGAAVAGAVIGLLARAVRRPLRSLPPGLQAWLWWLVAARLLLQLAGVPAVELAWLPATERPPATAPSARAPGSDRADRPSLAQELAANAIVPESWEMGGAAAASSPQPLSAWGWVGAVWLLGAAGAIAHAAMKLGAQRRLVAGVEAITDRHALAELARTRRLVGVSRRVQLARSTSITTPLVAGLVRPKIVLPARPELRGEELRLTLFHELLHIRRGDAWRALVPALARRLLFFHPLAHVAEREFALATEAACDAAVVRLAGAPAEHYGSLLVRFALGSRHAAGFAATWPLAGRAIHRRLDMLALPAVRPRQLALVLTLAGVAAVVVATPVRLVAGESPSPPAPPSPAAAISLEALEEDPTPPLAPLAPAAPTAGERRSAAPAPASPPLAPRPAAGPLPPLSPPSPPSLPDLDGADWLILTTPGERISIHAPHFEQLRAGELFERSGRPLLLLGRDGRSFVVRDEEAVEELRELLSRRWEIARERLVESRELHREAMDRARAAMEEGRRALAEARESDRLATSRLERTAEREARRVEQLERELTRLADERLSEAADRARAAARELADLREALERAREQSDADVGRAGEALELRQAIEMKELAERLENLDIERLEIDREIEERLRESVHGLELRLEELFERGLAEPLEQ